MKKKGGCTFDVASHLNWIFNYGAQMKRPPGAMSCDFEADVGVSIMLAAIFLFLFCVSH